MLTQEDVEHEIKMVVAKTTGLNDAKYDGIDTSSMLSCRCKLCLSSYYEGWDEGIKELMGDKNESS